MSTPELFKVEVIVILGGRLTFIKETLESLIRNKPLSDCHISLLGNACDSATTDYIQSAIESYPEIDYLAIEASPVASVNDVVHETNAEYICFIPGNVIVPERWLDEMLAVMARNLAFGEVMALGNAGVSIAAPIPSGCSLNTLDWFFKARSKPPISALYMDMSACVLVESESFREKGFLDEDYRTLAWALLDISLASIDKGPQAHLAEKIYVYRFSEDVDADREHDRAHLLSKAGSSSNLKKMSRHNSKHLAPLLREIALDQRWTPLTTARETYRALRDHYRRGDYLSVVKAALVGLARLPTGSTAVASKNFTSKMVTPAKLRVTYVLHNITVAGGVISVVQLANELALLGIEVRVVALYQYAETKAWNWYTQPIIFKDADDLINNFPESDIAVATHWTTANWVQSVVANGGAKVSAYFLQDYESWFFPESDTESRAAVLDTYAMAENRIVKSSWLQNLVQQDGFSSKKIPLGLDTNTYYHRDVLRSSATTIVAMARPGTPRRGFSNLIEALGLIKAEYPDTEVILFGQDISDQDIPFDYEGVGVVSSPESMAELYSRATIFIDASDFQGFGRTALEAMACNVACILTEVGGVTEYAVSNENCILVPPGDPRSIFQAFAKIVGDTDFYQSMVSSGLGTAQRFGHKREAKETADFFQSLADRD